MGMARTATLRFLRGIGYNHSRFQALQGESDDHQREWRGVKYAAMGTISLELDKGIKAAAATLKASGAREVYLFGSAATGTMREGSDIDLAVSGLPPENYFRALALAGDVLKRPIDLVDLDEENAFTRYLKQEGELVRVA